MRMIRRPSTGSSDQQNIAMTGTAVWAVREDGKLLCNWVERASFELYQRLRNQ